MMGGGQRGWGSSPVSGMYEVFNKGKWTQRNEWVGDQMEVGRVEGRLLRLDVGK